MSMRTHFVQSRAAANPRSSPAERGRHAVVLLAIGTMLFLASACGESAGTNAGTSAPEVVAEAKAAVAANRQGTDRALPTSAPKPQAGKNVWVISCSQAAEGCSRPAAGAQEAGQVIGWQMTVFDGKGSPDVFASGIRSAIAAKADAIILDAVDCVAVKSALQEAHQAGVKIYGIFSMDCDDALAGGGESLFDAELTYEGGMSFGEYAEGPFIRSLADYVIAKTDGEAQIIEFTQDDALIAKHLGKGFEARIKDCSGCTIVAEVPITFNDLISGNLQAKAAAALTRYPQANVLYGLYDSALILGISQAVIASGRNDDLLVPGGEGLSPNIGFVRDNKGQDSIIGSPANWLGWAAVDGVNRLLQGQPQVDAGIGLQTLDRDGPLLAKTTYYDGNIDAKGNPKVDYQAHYKNIWSGS
ncbi:sugar ABC transporter substrate-binding protein [Antrihabitans stalactiti]|uniref:Substrate-binding domain-containing protein n=1 Tax=Antrihabitans stalactiti TaxID=2584121 RepID=A0A848KN17_9NOCA|nr:substrate-binding domain-containing protein [Antrihabitans stalactiti]NMN98344.1 substrate-binding domain-containing protein [Antrihabitans stalactiti]